MLQGWTRDMKSRCEITSAVERMLSFCPASRNPEYGELTILRHVQWFNHIMVNISYCIAQ